jgi:hypothetical protein
MMMGEGYCWGRRVMEGWEWGGQRQRRLRIDCSRDVQGRDGEQRDLE